MQSNNLKTIMNIKALQTLYPGFEITQPIGNNVFSYEQRQNKTIFVSPLAAQGNLSDLQIGSRIVFSEIEEGIEKNFVGLKNFLYYPYQGKDIFIFDNHNHAFFFWLAGYLQGKIEPGLALVHIDQHSDMREPAEYPDFVLEKKLSLQKVFEYTNLKLNVGNFIQPALRLGLFSEIQIIDSTTSFESPVQDDFILDIDMDIFSDDMDYIDKDEKIDKIISYITKAKFITIATSPYFINQKRAITILNRLLQ